MELRGIGTTQRRRPVEAIPTTMLENRVIRSITIDPTVGSQSNFFTSFCRLFSMELHGIGTIQRQRPVGAIPPTALENRVKRSITIDPTVGSRSNFFPSFRRQFSMELRGISTTRRRRPVGAIPTTVLESGPLGAEREQIISILGFREGELL